MDTKSLIVGIVSFIAGGLLVSIVATTSTPQHAMGAVSDALKNAKGEEFDKAFIAEMIPHHQSAVEMAKLAKERASHDEIKELSNEIIAAQEKEISIMRQWQNEWGVNSHHNSR